ncbi:hypothetical protein [Polaribacter staleyi]|uniref:hypothetical protein n=1 Tax=Polaribacter staleyi TaxID=2022337 RepID=UPI0031BB3597
MKITISIITWINRIIMIPFLMTLLIAIFDNEIFLYSMYIAFVLGLYQILSFLGTLFFIKKVGARKVKEIVAYVLIVLFYFLISYLIAENYRGINLNSLFLFLVVAVPILLSVFWTYILESIHKKI